MADTKTEAERAADAPFDGRSQASNDSSATGSESTAENTTAGEAASSSGQAGTSGSLGSRFGKIGLVAIAVVLAALVFMFAGAGTLNVGVSSSSGNADEASAVVALYKGDVTAVLSDDDPSNDPEPLEVNNVEVGHRTSFSIKELGQHTVQATLVDADGAAKSAPVTVNMFGIDSFAELVVA